MSSRITLITVTFLSAGYSFRVDGELGLLLDRGGGGGAGARRRGDRDRGGGGDAELLLHHRRQLHDLDDAHLGNCIEDFVFDTAMSVSPK